MSSDHGTDGLPALPPMKDARRPLSRLQESLINVVALAALAAWGYGVILLVEGERRRQGAIYLGAAALGFLIVYLGTRGAVKRRRARLAGR